LFVFQFVPREGYSTYYCKGWPRRGAAAGVCFDYKTGGSVISVFNFTGGGARVARRRVYHESVSEDVSHRVCAIIRANTPLHYNVRVSCVRAFVRARASSVHRFVVVLQLQSAVRARLHAKTLSAYASSSARLRFAGCRPLMLHSGHPWGPSLFVRLFTSALHSFAHVSHFHSAL